MKIKIIKLTYEQTQKCTVISLHLLVSLLPAYVMLDIEHDKAFIGCILCYLATFALFDMLITVVTTVDASP